MKVNIIKTITFLAVFCVLFNGVSWFFRPMAENCSIIYYEAPNTIDVLITPHSQVFCGINPNVLWQEDGIAAFDYVSSGQTTWATYNFLIEALKTQKPKVVVFDVLCLFRRYANDYRPGSQPIHNTFRPSFNKLDMIQKGVEPKGRVSTMVDLLYWHTRWRNISQNSLPYTEQDYNQKSFHRYKGFYVDYIFKVSSMSAELNDTNYPSTETEGEIAEKSLFYFFKIIELSREKGFDLLLVKTPSTEPFTDKKETEVYNTVRRIAAEQGLTFLDYNDKQHRDAMGFDFTTDMADVRHLNTSGATKLTRYMGSYLKLEYDLPDRRGDPKYASWDESAEGYFQFEALERVKTKADLCSYLEALEGVSQDLIFVTGVKEGVSENLEFIAEPLKQIGISQIEPGGSYICVYDPVSGFRYEETSATKKLRGNIYKEGLPINVEVVSAGQSTGNTVSIKINGKEQTKNRRGLNVVIYDKKLERIFDSFYVDTFEDEPFTIKR